MNKEGRPNCHPFLSFPFLDYLKVLVEFVTAVRDSMCVCVCVCDLETRYAITSRRY